MDHARINDLFESINQLKLAVVGDLCLDMVMHLDEDPSEVSAETGLPGRAVSRYTCTPGGGANVAANLASLGVASVAVAGVVGDDLFGRELVRQLEAMGIDTATVTVQPKDVQTVVFGKPVLAGAEQARLDFGFRNKLSDASEKAMLEALDHLLQSCDAVVLNQQVPGSMSPRFIEEAGKLIARHDALVLLDSRDHGGAFEGVTRKLNELEMARLAGAASDSSSTLDLKQLHDEARILAESSGRPVFVTRGERGMLAADGDEVHTINGIQLLGKTDPVGAGDTVAAVLTACLAAGAGALEAAELANLAAAVTVGKVHTTGTATRDEIAVLAETVDYVYRPELAEDVRGATYIEGTEIERVCPPDELTPGRIRHAVFDHDGTISVLRQGWEAIMEPVMIRAILGDRFATAEPSLYAEVRDRVREFIDRSTGIQTILQMEALVQMVHEAGYVPEDRVLDKFGYKQVYNDALMEMVNHRIEKLESGQLSIEDYTVKGAVPLLYALRERGIRLYLASGTDRQDVIDEATRLGYAEVFDGGIHGSVGDVSKYSKKMVIEKIMADNNLHGSELVVFGDGPVEIRECRRRGGVAVGLASDEVRRYGLDAQKRTRLIRAGADLVLPDFSQLDALLEVLGM